MSQAILSKQEYLNKRQAHWENTHNHHDPRARFGEFYRQNLADIYRFLIGEKATVLEIGCGRGDLLAAIEPGKGVGIDFSQSAIKIAQERHPALDFVCCEAMDYVPNGVFDAIILSDLLNDIWDVQTLLGKIRTWCTPNTRIIINNYSRVWQPAISLGRTCGWTAPALSQNWLTRSDVLNLMYIEGIEAVALREEILWPFRTPLLQSICNRYLVRLWPFNLLALSYFIVARIPEAEIPADATVSVVVPARNEEGNIKKIFDEVPQLGGGTELIFVEGHSRDDTYGAIEREIAARKNITAKLYRQEGDGKGDAVRKGFANATGDVLMILDADLTVPPEDLHRFFRVLTEGKAEYVNGVRLVYPMNDNAMQFLNFIGNKFFSLTFSWLLGRSIKDTLCGTKAISRHNYERIAANRSYFGDFDPFGDFDLIFGAAKLNLKFADLPVRYGPRLYSETNISRWQHGFLLLTMVVFAIHKIKFIPIGRPWSATPGKPTGDDR